MNSLNSLVAFVFVLGVLVFVHEFGHFLVARWLGVKVITFSIGFGPKLLKFRRNDIEYCISAFPLGGYVKMAGENPEEPLSGGPGEFLGRSRWDRFRILVAGPLMNIVLAVALMWVVNAQGAQVPAFQDAPVVVGAVTPKSPAEQSGIKPGDRIIKVGTQPVATWEDFYLSIGGRANREVPITLLREGRDTVITVTPVGQTRMQVGDIGVLPDVHPSIVTLESGGPAEKAGVRIGDIVLTANGETIVFSGQLSTAIRKFPDVPMTLRVMRASAPLDITVTPRRQGTIGVIGVNILDAVKLVQPGILGALRMSIDRNIQFSGLIARTLGGLFTRETSPSQLMGPVAIAQLSGDYAALGWLALFSFMASLSLNLGLLNLLPIPILDGGHIFIMAIESVARRNFSLKVKERMMMAGFVALMLLMVTVVYNDLARFSWFERFIPGGH
ncbi:MAG: RIP metalloprotease RseP [Acidobacteria bacterium]|nr:RIP metalloprotease RseP [Acidobacteriota bacterium]